MDKVAQDDKNLHSKPIASFLMLGKSGAGKTTLINAFVNYFHNKSYQDDRLVTIPQSEGQRCSFSAYEDIDHTNETVEQYRGQGRTKDFHSYVFETDEKRMIIIDTPGMADPKGHKEDQEHVKKIVEGIKKTGFLQAIVFVVGDECRLSPCVRYYVDEIRKIMTKPCLEQSIVVCTKTTGKIPKDLKKIFSSDFGITLDDNRWFTMDNKPFFEHSEDEEESKHLEYLWNYAKKGFNNIYNKVASFEPIPTHEMQILFTKRECIEQKIQDKIKLLESIRVLSAEIEKLKQEQIEIHTEKQDFINVEAFEKYRIFSKRTNYNCTQCNKTCREDASFAGYVISVVFTLSIYYWMTNSSLCKCTHSKKCHVYENSRRFVGLDEFAEKILREIEKENRDKGQQKLKKRDALDGLKKSNDEQIHEIAKLTAEIESLGIIPVTYDSLLEYLDDVIESYEKSSENRHRIREAKQDKERYKRMVEELTKIKECQVKMTN